MFVFYDTETTGLSRDFDQILQIALVFTDDDLNILSSKKIECRRSSWIVPAPGALLTTGFLPDDLKNNPYSHYEMMQEVYKWVGGQHWPLTFAGYNSVRYDDPILAQNLYQNLLDPCLTSAKNDVNGQSNNSTDIMIMVRAISQYMPGALKLDMLTEKGNVTTSLEHVSQQNGVVLSSEDAHDAMNDIKATVGVAKVVKKAAPQIWDQMMKLSTVNGVDAFLASNEVFTYSMPFYGKVQNSVMTSLAYVGKASQAIYDLSFDPTPYLDMTVDQLKKFFAVQNIKKPFALVEKNCQPVLMPMDMSEPVLSKAYDERLYAARAQTIRSSKTFQENVAKAALLAEQEKAAAVKRVSPEMTIEDTVPGSVRPRLDQWIKEFHAAPEWKDAANLVQDFYVRFKDDLATDSSLSRFVKFAGRIVYEHAPEELSADKQEAMKRHIAARLLNTDIQAPYMTIAKARKELEEIEQNRVPGKKWAEVTDSQLRTLKLYYTSLEKEYAPYAPAAPINDNSAAVQAPQADADKKSAGPKL